MTYAFRKSALENEKRYLLQEDSLIIEDLKNGSKRKLSLSSIRTVHLKFLAKRNMPDAYLCTIKSNEGGELILSSQHYKGIASFEDRAKDYSEFVRALHADLAQHKVLFSKGLNSFSYWGSMLAFILVGLVIALIGLTALFPYGIFTLLVLVYLFFRLKKHFKINKPGVYDPKEIPAELLP